MPLSLPRLALVRLRAWLLGLAPHEATFQRRGFDTAAIPEHRRLWLEGIGQTFIRGYNAGLRTGDPTALTETLSQVEVAQRGWCYEGAAMALALRDRLPFAGSGSWGTFLTSSLPHRYLLLVGAGWVMARLRLSPSRYLEQLQPQLLAAASSIDSHLTHADHLRPLHLWLVIDGAGFHDGYFHPGSVIFSKRPQRRSLRGAESGYYSRAYDQGVGRSLWFVTGADVERIVATIANFDSTRRADLYSGVGLAATFAGGVARNDLEQLRDLAGEYRTHLQQGVVFAAKARHLAQSVTRDTELACRVLTDSTPRTLAQLADSSLREVNVATHLALESPEPRKRRTPLATDGHDYEEWRTHIRRYFQTTANRQTLPAESPRPSFCQPSSISKGSQP